MKIDEEILCIQSAKVICAEKELKYSKAIHKSQQQCTILLNYAGEILSVYRPSIKQWAVIE